MMRKYAQPLLVGSGWDSDDIHHKSGFLGVPRDIEKVERLSEAMPNGLSNEEATGAGLDSSMWWFPVDD